MNEIAFQYLSTLLILFLMSFVQSHAQGEPEPQFGNVVIQMSGRVVSPLGNFAAWFEENTDNETIVLYLWDNQQYRTNTGHVQSEPIKSVVLDYQHGPAPISLVVLAFSPDERYLAVRKDFDLTLLTVPDLEISSQYYTPAEASIITDELSWSVDDDTLIAFRIDDPLSLVVWDIESDKTYNQPIWDYGEITPMGDGWLVRSDFFWVNRETIFWSCTRLVEQCTRHTFESITPGPGGFFSMAASRDGQFVILSWNEERIWVWRRHVDGSYHLDDTSMASSGLGRVLSISPDSQYLVTAREGNLYIWSTENFTLVSDLEPSCGGIAFLPDSNFFVTICEELTLTLYEINHALPIDKFDLTSLPTINYSRMAEMGMLDAMGSSMSVSEDGEWFWSNLGGYGPAMLMIPLISAEN